MDIPVASSAKQVTCYSCRSQNASTSGNATPIGLIPIPLPTDKPVAQKTQQDVKTPPSEAIMPTLQSKGNAHAPNPQDSNESIETK